MIRIKGRRNTDQNTASWRGKMAEKKQVSASEISSSTIKNEHIFKLVNPFVEVKEGKVAKFEDTKLAIFDKQVADYLLKEVILEMQKFGECYARNAKVTELQYRPVSCAIFPVFAGLAPKKDELLDGEKPKNKTKDVVSSFDMSSVAIELEGTVDQSRPNSRASDASKDSDRSGFSFTGDTFVHEDGTLLRAHEAVDVRASVTYHNNQVVGRSIFEMKGEQKWPFGLYQGLNYGARNLAYENIKLQRFKKFHVVIMGIDSVGCAVIDPIGFVTVKQQKLAGIEDFKKQVKSKIEYLKQKKGKTEEIKTLEARYIKPDAKVLLASLTKEMVDKMKEAANKAGGEYVPEFKSETKLLVGTATFRKKAFSMNKFPIVKPLQEELTIVKGLARVIYGDRVLDWKLPALEKHAKKRKDESLALVKKVLAGGKP